MDQGQALIPNPSLPVDVIMEILSLLPLLTLLRFKLVSKEFKAIIDSEEFWLKHYANSIACVWGILDKKAAQTQGDKCPICSCSYQCLAIYYGMLVEKSKDGFPKKYRIRNPVLRRVIQLPDPQEGLFGIFLSRLPSPGDFKLISLFDNGKEAENGCEMLTLDGSAIPSWRKLTNFPNLSQLGEKVLKTKILSIGNVLHCILLFDASSSVCMHILSIDILKEEFLGIISPVLQFPDMITIEPFVYNGEVGFVQVVKDGLQVYSLENCKDFVKKMVLPLDFLSYDVMIFSVEDSEIWFRGWKELYVYDTVSKRVTSKNTQLQWERDAFPYKLSLFTVKGMELKEMINPDGCYTELKRV